MSKRKDSWPFWDDEFEADPNSQVVDEAGESENPVAQKPSENNNLTIKKKKVIAPKYSSRDTFRYASLGTEFLGAVLAGTFLGWAISWLIGRFTGHMPTWLIAVGVVLGAAAGFLNIFGFLKEEERKEEQEKRGSSK
ncbi:MAG: AtpZ/AtpI family protein [Actinomycetota bacterium]|nr:AtpZ/AtpI family protein [Actinomycetota bacterium]